LKHCFRNINVELIDTALAAKEVRKAKRIQMENYRRERAKEQLEQASASALLDEEDSSGEEEHVDDESYSDETVVDRCSTPPSKRMRATTKVVTSHLAAALDRTKMSDRKATFVIATTAQSLGHDISNLSISRSSTKRERERYRAEMAAALKTDLSGDVPLVVHWDGKLMNDLCGKEHVDRLPVKVSGFGVCQFVVEGEQGGWWNRKTSSVISSSSTRGVECPRTCSWNVL